MFSWLKKYFIPSEENGYKPHFLRSKSALIVLAAIAIIELAFLAQTLFVFKRIDFLSAVLPGVLSALANDERAQNGATQLAYSPILEQAAKLKAEDMAKRGYFSHTGPDGELPWMWLQKAGYDYSYAGENLAIDFSESKDVADAWMNSPSHRANVVKKEFTEIGIGVASGVYQGRSTVFVVEFFGRPAKIASVKVAAAAEVKTVEIPVGETEEPHVLGEVTAGAKNVSAAGEARQNFISSVKKALSLPRTAAAYAFGALALLAAMALALAVFIKIHVQHPALIVSGLVIIVAAAFFYSFNENNLKMAVKVPADTMAASVIKAF